MLIITFVFCPSSAIEYNGFFSLLPLKSFLSGFRVTVDGFKDVLCLANCRANFPTCLSISKSSACV